MRIARIEKISPRVIATVCFTAILLALSTAVWAQAQNWWVLPAQGAAERGKIEEIKLKKKVYVSVAFDSSGPGQITSTVEQADIRKNVLDGFKAHKDLMVVSSAATAEFAVVVKASAATAGPENERPGNFSVATDAEEVSVDVTVLVPGAKLADGTFKSRSVWQVSSPNIQMEAGAGARFVVEGFLWELKKLRDGK